MSFRGYLSYIQYFAFTVLQATWPGFENFSRIPGNGIGKSESVCQHVNSYSQVVFHRLPQCTCPTGGSTSAHVLATLGIINLFSKTSISSGGPKCYLIDVLILIFLANVRDSFLMYLPDHSYFFGRFPAHCPRPFHLLDCLAHSFQSVGSLVIGGN